MFSSSTKIASDLIASAGHEVGVDGLGTSIPDNASLILPTGHENSNPISLSSSLSKPSLSTNKRRKLQFKIDQQDAKVIYFQKPIPENCHRS